MRPRDVYLANAESVSDSQTKTVDVDVSDPISAIDVIYDATNGATTCLDKEIHDDVSKIELVDGSDVVFSLPMIEAQALNYIERGRLPQGVLSEAASAVQREKATIHFGRFLNDPRFWLNPAKFKNLQLKLTHALTISATAGFATGTGYLTVIAHLMEELGAGPEGYFMSKVLDSWTSVSSGDRVTDLPNDFAYRLIMVKALLSTYRHDEILSKLKLTMDVDKYIPFELDTPDLRSLNRLWFPMAEQERVLLRADASTVETDIFDAVMGLYNPTADLHVGSLDAFDADQATINLLVLAVTPTIAKQTTATAGALRVSGWQPHACLAVPFGKLDDPASWLDVTKYGKVQLKSTQATASGVCSIVVQQLRK